LVAGAAARIISLTRLNHRDLDRNPDTLDLQFETERRPVLEASAQQSA
jgi:hypothetical protein